MSDYFFQQMNNFQAISWREEANFWWDDDDSQHTWLTEKQHIPSFQSFLG